MALRLYRDRVSIHMEDNLKSSYEHAMINYLCRSFCELRAFPHSYHQNNVECPSYAQEYAEAEPYMGGITRNLVYDIAFDNEGRYIASVTGKGCLTVHSYESLHNFENDENKLAAHVSINTKVGAVKWNPCNQKEVAYAKVDDCLLPIYNVNTQQTIIAYSTEDPEWTILSDIAFKSDGSSIYACGFGGCRGQIASWDPRQGIKPTSTMITNSWALSSIELYGPNTVVAGGGDGYVYLWDVRRVSSFFYTYPLIPHSVRKKSGYVLKNRREGACQWMIQSIRQNPSCPRQLAVYQKGGGINILDMPGNKFVTTHFHSLPSEGDMAVVNDKVEYKFEEAGPSWLPKYSIYLAPFRDGIRLLDFHPSRDSPLHVDYRGGNQEGYIDIILSKTVVACAAHPFQNVIVAGTQTGSLLLISQSLESIMSEENDETNDETGNGAHTVTKLRSSRIAKRKYS